MTINCTKDYSKVKGSTELHNKLKKEFMIMVSRTFDDAFAITYDVGFFRAWSNPEIPVRCGVVGVPDIIVFVQTEYVLFDAKTGKAVFSTEQKSFAKTIKEIAGEHRVYKLTTINRGLEIIETIRQGIREGIRNGN